MCCCLMNTLTGWSSTLTWMDITLFIMMRRAGTHLRSCWKWTTPHWASRTEPVSFIMLSSSSRESSFTQKTGNSIIISKRGIIVLSWAHLYFLCFVIFSAGRLPLDRALELIAYLKSETHNVPLLQGLGYLQSFYKLIEKRNIADVTHNLKVWHKHFLEPNWICCPLSSTYLSKSLSFLLRQFEDLPKWYPLRFLVWDCFVFYVHI